MNFFSINPSFCKNCAECERKCPVNAVCSDKDNYKIDDSKCIACGICFKCCSRNAVEINIDRDKIDEWERSKEENIELENKLNALSEENRLLKEKLFTITDRFRNIVNKLPYGVTIVDKSNKMTFSNTSFISMMDYQTRCLAEDTPGLVGIDIQTVLPETICGYITESLNSGEDNLNKEVVIGNHTFNMSAYSISKSNFTLVMFRDIFNDQILKEEIFSRIQEVIDQNMAMIQNIGFLMGEGTSKTTKTLNAIISSLKHSK